MKVFLVLVKVFGQVLRENPLYRVFP